MASVGGPLLFSNKYAYSNLNMATPIISHKMDIHGMVKHDIQQKRHVDGVPHDSMVIAQQATL